MSGFRNNLLQSAFASVAAESEPAVTEMEYQSSGHLLEQANQDVQRDSETLIAADSSYRGLEALINSLEAHCQAGLDTIAGSFLHEVYSAHATHLGFEAIDIPALECFKTNSPMATQLSMEAVEGRLKQVIDAIIALLKRFMAHLKVFWNRLRDSSKSLEQRVKAYEREMSNFTDEIETFELKLGRAEAYLVSKQSDTPSILALGETVEFANQLLEYEREVSGSSSAALLELLELSKSKDKEKESFASKIRAISGRNLPTPKFITKLEKNSNGGFDGSSQAYAAGYVFNYTTMAMPHLDDLLTIVNVLPLQDTNFIAFEPSEKGVKTLEKSDIAGALHLLGKLAGTLQNIGRSFEASEQVVGRVVNELQAEARVASAEDYYVRNIAMYLKNTIEKQQTLIRVGTSHINDVARAYLLYAAKSITAHKIKA